MKKILLVIAALLFAAIATAQPPRDQWAHTYGERLNDFFWDVYCTEEGNLACVGKKVTEQQNRGCWSQMNTVLKLLMKCMV